MKDYLKAYNRIIKKAKNRPKPKVYYEKHHIIPRCMGGCDDEKNLVKLTMDEHYYVHYLLAKIYPENKKLTYAFWMMCNKSDKKRPKPSHKMKKLSKKLMFTLNPSPR